MRLSFVLLLSLWYASGARAQSRTGVARERVARCAERERGRVDSVDGALVFLADAARDCPDGCTRVDPRTGATYWQPHATLLRRPGIFSHVLPYAGGAVAVRTTRRQAPPYGQDELVVISGPRLRVRPLWSPRARLILLGLVEDRAVLLAYDGSESRLVGVDLRTRRRVRSGPLPVVASSFHLDPRWLYWSHRTIPLDGAPIVRAAGPDGFLLPCTDGICEAHLDGGAFRVEHRRERFSPGDEERLWVDGRPVDGAPVMAASCVVRTDVWFPGPTGVTDCVTRVEPESPDEGERFEWVHVHPGCALSFTFLGYGVPLPWGERSIRCTHRGCSLRLPAPTSAWSWGDCHRGLAELRGNGGPPRAFEWEEGYCE